MDVQGGHRGRELALLDDVDCDVGVGVHGRGAVVEDADLEEVLVPNLVVEGPRGAEGAVLGWDSTML